jgi:hypothetical protein
MNRSRGGIILIALCLVLTADAKLADTVVIVALGKTNPVEQLAAEELAGYLSPSTRKRVLSRHARCLRPARPFSWAAMLPSGP